MEKPINPSLVYRSKDTNSVGYDFPSVVSYDQRQEMNAISEKILNLIVSKHS